MKYFAIGNANSAVLIYLSLLVYILILVSYAFATENNPEQGIALWLSLADTLSSSCFDLISEFFNMIPPYSNNECPH